MEKILWSFQWAHDTTPTAHRLICPKAAKNRLAAPAQVELRAGYPVEK